MALQSFKDLGKNAKDLFDKGYNFGKVKCDVKHSVDKDVKFTSKVAIDNDTSNVSMDLESAFALNSLKITETWNSSNQLTSEVVYEKNNIKLSPKHTFWPTTGTMNGGLVVDQLSKAKHRIGGSLAYRTPACHTAIETDFDGVSTPPLTLHGVGKYSLGGKSGGLELLFGGLATLDLAGRTASHHAVALGVNGQKFSLTTSLTNANQIDLKLHNKISHRLEFASLIGWGLKDAATNYGLAAKYKLDDNVALQAKLMQAKTLDLATTIKANQGVELCASLRLNVANLNAGGHKLGLGVSIDL